MRAVWRWRLCSQRDQAAQIPFAPGPDHARDPIGAVAPGYAFVTVGTPKVTSGPLIVDNSGDPVWFQPVPGKSLADFKVQQFGGRSVLTWWEGTIVSPGFGRGEIVIADSSYQVLQRVTAGRATKPTCTSS
jgi:hypothetical protein